MSHNSAEITKCTRIFFYVYVWCLMDMVKNTDWNPSVAKIHSVCTCVFIEATCFLDEKKTYLARRIFLNKNISRSQRWPYKATSVMFVLFRSVVHFDQIVIFWVLQKCHSLHHHCSCSRALSCSCKMKQFTLSHNYSFVLHYTQLKLQNCFFSLAAVHLRLSQGNFDKHRSQSCFKQLNNTNDTKPQQHLT